MNNKEDKKIFINKEYEELVKDLKKELPNIVLPSMGIIDDDVDININGKDFVKVNNVEEV